MSSSKPVEKIHGSQISLYTGLTTTSKWPTWKQILKVKTTLVLIFMLQNDEINANYTQMEKIEKFIRFFKYIEILFEFSIFYF